VLARAITRMNRVWRSFLDMIHPAVVKPIPLRVELFVHRYQMLAKKRLSPRPSSPCPVCPHLPSCPVPPVSSCPSRLVLSLPSRPVPPVSSCPSRLVLSLPSRPVPPVSFCPSRLVLSSPVLSCLTLPLFSVAPKRHIQNIRWHFYFLDPS
jgi:hypothetical protein